MASSNIHVDIVSAEREIFSGEADMVFAPGEQGELGIAPRHAPLLTRMKPGVVRVQHAGEEQVFYVSGGILEIQPHMVTVLSDTAQRAADIDEAAAQDAMRKAQEALANQSSEMDIAKVQVEILEQAARLKAIQQIRNKKR